MITKKHNLLAILLFVTIIGTSLIATNANAFYPPGSLLKGSQAEIFLVTSDGQLSWIPDSATFNALGYKWENIVDVSDDELSHYTFGPTLEATFTAPSLPTPQQSQARVRKYFADLPIMIDIADCESDFLQFHSDGSVVLASGLYVGVFQIDKNIHAEYAKTLGMDIFTLDGNLAYARHLYEQLGTQPWPRCSVTVNSTITRDLQLNDDSPEVATLQKLLNNFGFKVSSSGPGSPGSETNYFGTLTQNAVERFQCARGIVCSGSSETTGYGMVGPKTRRALLGH